MNNETEIQSLTREELEARRKNTNSLLPQTSSDNPLKLHVLASGSKGNCCVIESSLTGDFFVIDCGISCKKFLAGIDFCGLYLEKLKGLVVTHEHIDHTKGLGVVYRMLKKHEIEVPLCVNDSVRKASKELSQLGESVPIRNFNESSQLSFSGIEVYPFATHHDTAKSFGFRIESDGDAIGYLTDSGTLDDAIYDALSNVRILGIESNHDSHMLEVGPYPYKVKARIASDVGHLSNEQAKQALSRLLSNRLERVVALHISESNNTYRLPVNTLQTRLNQESHSACAYCGFQNRVVSF